MTKKRSQEFHVGGLLKLLASYPKQSHRLHVITAVSEKYVYFFPPVWFGNDRMKKRHVKRSSQIEINHDLSDDDVDSEDEQR